MSNVQQILWKAPNVQFLPQRCRFNLEGVLEALERALSSYTERNVTFYCFLCTKKHQTLQSAYHRKKKKVMKIRKTYKETPGCFCVKESCQVDNVTSLSRQRDLPSVCCCCSYSRPQCCSLEPVGGVAKSIQLWRIWETVQSSWI